MFKANIRGWEKTLRIGIGVALLRTDAFSPLGWWGMVGLVPLRTGQVGSCPLCTIIGMGGKSTP